MKTELVVPLRVSSAGRRGGFAATTELGGQPICSYGATAGEAERRAKGSVFRLLGNLLERGVEIDAVRFKTTSG